MTAYDVKLVLSDPDSDQDLEIYQRVIADPAEEPATILLRAKQQFWRWALRHDEDWAAAGQRLAVSEVIESEVRPAANEGFQRAP